MSVANTWTVYTQPMNNIIKRMWEWFLVIMSCNKQRANKQATMMEPSCKTNLSTSDVLVETILKNELIRQTTSLNLIASENLVLEAVLKVQNNVFINKRADGYPGYRHYEGCVFIDELEKVVIDRTKRLFKCKYANVQPYSGSQTNQALMLSLLSPGDPIMCMRLEWDGHLTHGLTTNTSGMWFNTVTYGVDPKTGTIDMNNVLNCAIRHRPKLIIVGSTSYPRTTDWKASEE